MNRFLCSRFLFVCNFIFCGAGFAGESWLAPQYQMPFEFNKGIVCVEVKINGEGPFLAAIDTGTNENAVDINLASELRLSKSSKNESIAAGIGKKNIKLYQTSVSSLEVGGNQEKELNVVVIPLPPKLPCKVVLGYNFLQNKVLQIDYPRRKINFYTKFPYSQNEKPRVDGLVVLPFKLVDNTPEINGVLINGQKAEAILDTGGTYGLVFFSSEFTDRHGLGNVFENSKSFQAHGYAGSESAKCAVIKNVAVGGLQKRSVMAALVNDLKLQTAFGAGVCGLGEGYLKDYRVTFDYKDRLMALQK